MKLVLPGLLVTLIGCASQAQVAEFQTGGPTAAEVELIEQGVVMPAGARPIERYLRTYFPDGERIIGHYRLGPPTGVRSQPMPDGADLDGGCSVVTVVINRGTSTVEDVVCNGVA